VTRGDSDVTPDMRRRVLPALILPPDVCPRAAAENHSQRLRSYNCGYQLQEKLLPLHWPSLCNVLTCLSGVSLTWANKIRYLGLFIVKSRLFKCSLESANHVEQA